MLGHLVMVGELLQGRIRSPVGSAGSFSGPEAMEASGLGCLSIWPWRKTR